jgi:hypothetical protein
MSKRYLAMVAVVGSLILSSAGCQQLPQDRAGRGAIIGGAGGAAAGAAIGGPEHRLLGAVLGGLIGAGGGYVVGANMERVREEDREGAREAAVRAQERPATVEDALTATTADLNNDGFVTLDEVIAMHRAGFSDQRMIDYMEATDQVFELTPEQRQHLISQGVSRNVVDQMERINQQQREQLRQGEVIGRPPAPPAQPGF